MQKLSDWLEIAKYFSIAATMSFGVLGAAFETRDKTGRLNRWGRVAIIGVIISALLGAVSQKLERDAKHEDEQRASRVATEEQAQRLRTLENLAKLLQGSKVTLDALAESSQREIDIRDKAKANLDAASITLHLSRQNAANMALTVAGQRQIADTTADLLFQSYRQLTPLLPLTIEYHLVFPRNEPLFRAYLDRLREGGDTHIAVYEYGSEDYPQLNKSEGKAFAALMTHRIDIFFNQPTGLGSGDGEDKWKLGLWLNTAPVDFQAVVTGKQPSGEPVFQRTLFIEFDEGGDNIEQTVTVENPRDFTPAENMTILSRVDLVGAEMQVVLDWQLPLETRLDYVGIKTGSSSGTPVQIPFNDAHRQISFQAGREHVTYRKILTAEDLKLSLPLPAKCSR